LAARPEVFELMHDTTLFAAHNEMHFYTWVARDCCLPKGATRATLRDDLHPLKRLRLCAGDVLILEERLGPNTGLATDADPTRRHAVRLTRVHPEAQRLFQNEVEINRIPAPPVTDPLTNQAIVEIEWHAEDALPFPLCISAVTDEPHDRQYDVSVALGNIVLADHGMTFTDEPDNRPFDPDTDPTSLDPGMVPDPNPVLTKVSRSSGDRCVERPITLTPPRYRPRLKQAPLTQAAPY